MAMAASACGGGGATPGGGDDASLGGSAGTVSVSGSGGGTGLTANGGATDDTSTDDPLAGAGSESGGATQEQGGRAGDGGTAAGGADPSDDVEGCVAPAPGAAPLRRLTRFEYSNSAKELLGTETNAGDLLPPELLGSGFGNDAYAQPSSAFLIEQYATAASRLATEALASPAFLERYAACASAEVVQDESACAEGFVRDFGAQAYRRPLGDDEVADLLSLQQQASDESDFRTSLSLIVEAILQTPDFLYRVELGESTPEGWRRPTGFEMASRLSYLLRAAPPDEELWDAAQAGTLVTPEQVRQQAERLVNAPEAREVVSHFFENYLPIGGLSDVARDPELYPNFGPAVGRLMQEETLRLIEHEVFEADGTWDSVLTAPYSFMNEELAAYYGVSGVSGDEFQQVDLDTTRRLGLLTQGAVLVGTTVTNYTNPVRRGGFLLSHILCIEVPLPPQDVLSEVKPPEPYSGDTGRERYSAHSEQAVCATCHAVLDPPGFALENFDAVGMWRDEENGVQIDASGSLSVLAEPFDGPVELVQQIAATSNTYSCFAENWQTFAYGRAVTAEDECSAGQLAAAFDGSGHNIKQLLVDLTQTDAFLYLPEGTDE